MPNNSIPEIAVTLEHKVNGPNLFSDSAPEVPPTFRSLCHPDGLGEPLVANPTGSLLTVNDYETQVHDVGPGWTGHDQVAQFGKKMIGIVAVQIILYGEILFLCPSGGFW